jgi:hypothetical protein
MNDILRLISGGGQGTGSILLSAIGAAMRGESPADFMRNLANNHPQLKQIDFNDLYGSAQKLCKDRGLNPDDVAKSIDGVVQGQITK